MYGQFIVIFALMFTGYFFRKIKVISEEMNQGLNRFIVVFAFPCFIFQKVAGLDMSAELMTEFLIAFALSVGLFFVYGFLAWGYAKARRFPKACSGTAEVLMIFPNNAFMGFPIAYLFFGDLGLLFMLANNIAMNLTMFSFGVYILRRNDTEKGFSPKTMIRCVLNPNIIALVTGLLFCLSGIRIPGTIDTYLLYIGAICTPMAMVFIGSTLVGNSIIKIIRNPIVLEAALNKNFIYPVVTYLMLAFSPLPKMITAIMIFAACFPSAAVATLLVETEGKDSELACAILVATTAVSIVSLPFAVKLINLLIL